MKITYDPVKRQKTLEERGLDFEEAPLVFAGRHFTREDDRKEYGEVRLITAGMLRERMVVMVWTPRGVEERKAIRKAAYQLGRRAEKAGSNAVKQAENQRELEALVHRGAGLGVDEKALSQSLQRGRVAYREEQQEHRHSSPGGGMGR